MTVEFVIGIDSSTQSTKAIAWDRHGAALAEGRSAIPMNQPSENRFEQEPADWWSSCVNALKELSNNVDMGAARAVAISNQRETIGFLDRDRRSVRPAMVWLDERAQDSVAEFSARFGADALHRISGKPVDLTPVVYRLHWLTRHEPETLDATDLFVDVHGYLTGRLCGKFTASWTSADPTGMFDITSMKWSSEILTSLNLDSRRFAPALAPGSRAGSVSERASMETGLPAGLPVITAGGDGQCAGLGVNAVRPGRAYLNLGTALITGAWGAEPTASLAWRTMTSPTGRGYFYEGVLRAGTFLIDWFMKQFVKSRKNAAFSSLEQKAAALPVGSSGAIVTPYLCGSMNPHWSMDASASIAGLRASHGPEHIYRAILESLSGEVARTTTAMKKAGVEIDMAVAVGGGANSALWQQMIADATGLPLRNSRSLEASSLGAAITAAKGIGWHPDFDAAAEAMSRMDDALKPSPRHRGKWDMLLKRQDRLNRLLVAEASSFET